MFGIDVFTWTPIHHADTKTFRLEDDGSSGDKPLIDISPGIRFTERPIDGLGYMTNAPQDADLTQIPRITTSLFGGLALQYPSGLGDGDLQGSTKAEVIASAKQKALQDDYGYGPYWIDEITTFGCADPNATNYCEDCDFHVGDWYCGYGCSDEYRKTDYLGNCLADCEDGYELVQASQAKPAKCVAIEKECDEGFELIGGECKKPPKTTITTQTEPADEPDGPNYALWGGIAVVAVIGYSMMS